MSSCSLFNDFKCWLIVPSGLDVCDFLYVQVKLWDAEKALSHEDEREEQAKCVRLQEREDKVAMRAGGRVKYGADVDKQYE